MLVLTRRPGEAVYVGDDTTLKLRAIRKIEGGRNRRCVFVVDLAVTGKGDPVHYSFKADRTFMIGEAVEVHILAVGPKKVRIGFKAPLHVDIVRTELVKCDHEVHGTRL